MPNESTYNPEVPNLDAIELPSELLELVEKIAEKVHDMWAAKRIAEGWKWGPRRNDLTLEHPCLVPYYDLPESEKEYDRATATLALKLAVYLGYDITKKL